MYRIQTKSRKQQLLSKVETVSVLDALALMADQLESNKKFAVDGFWDFVRDVWSQSFDNPDLFDAWHVGRICEDVEYALSEGLNYVSVLPRAHFKSTILGHAFAVWRLLKMGTNSNTLYLSYSASMAQYHIGELNKEVMRNPILTQWMID